jgi:hypothetical protein
MFRDATAPRQRTRLYVVHGGRHGSARIAQGEKKMNGYKFTQYPSNSSVSSGITMLVSVWFLVASGAILADPVSPYTQRALAERAHAQPAPLAQAADASANAQSPAAIAPAAHLTIVVEARRPATLVEASRSANL